MSDDTARINGLLQAWSDGNRQAQEELTELIYPVLKRLAVKRLAAVDPRITLQPTDLAHEAYLKLTHQREVSWQNREHFLAICGRLMRRIVVDYVRRGRRKKRGGGVLTVSLSGISERVADVSHPDPLALEQALEALEAVDPRAARIVELRYFGGLTVEETATVLQAGRTTVVRKWRYARAWLRDALEEP